MNWLMVALGAIPTAILAFLFHTLDVDHLKHKQETQLIEQQATDKQVCDNDKAITKESNDALQKSHDAIAARLAQLLQQPATCMPLSQPAQLPSSGQSKHAGSHGISPNWLRSFAATCEGYREEVNTCIDFTIKASTIKK